MKRSTKSGEFAYQAVYRYLMELITPMAPGSYGKLPSLRDLARRLEVSISTVQYAYSLLEHEGRVQSVPKSGYFARASDAGVPAAGAEQLWQTLQQGGAAQLMAPHGTHALPSLEASLLGIERQLLRQYPRAGAQVHPYGELELRTALAARYTRSVHRCWNAEDVYLAVDLCSLFETLVAALDLGGSPILVATPCSWRLLGILRMTGLRVIELPLGDDGSLDLERFAGLLTRESVRLVMLSSQLNCPHGSLIPTAQHPAIAALLDRHGAWLLDNDLDAEYCFIRPTACLRDVVDPERLLVFSSLERTVGVEVPFAYLLARHARRALQRRFLARGFRLPPLRQQAVARLYAKGKVDLHLEHMRGRMRERVSHLYRQMQVHLGAQLQFQMPAGGASIWAQVRAPVDTRQLFQRLLDQGLVITPGELFSLQGQFPRHLRLGWSCGQHGDLQHGLSLLSQALQRRE